MELKSAWALWSLAAVPVLAFLYWRTQRARRSVALRYASPARLAESVGRGPGRLRHLAPLLYLVSLSLMLFALARPPAVVSVPSEEGTVILVLDVSGSMRATDIRPSRIDAAKTAAIRFVERQRDNTKVRVGVVSFSDAAFVVQQPTTDRDATITAITRLSTARGTGIGRGLLAALDALAADPNDLPSDQFNESAVAGQAGRVPTGPAGVRAFAAATIVLLTDGVNTTPPTPLAVLDLATARGVRIYTIGLGTQTGGTIGGVGGGGFGRPQFARFDRDTLMRVAETTDGAYFDASSAEDLSRIYDGLVTQVVLRQEKTELGAGFVGVAALLAMLGSAWSLAMFNRLP